MYIYIYMYMYIYIYIYISVCVCTYASKKLTSLDVKTLVMLYKFCIFISSLMYVPSPTRKYNNIYTNT